jgi:hypothetical protein
MRNAVCVSAGRDERTMEIQVTKLSTGWFHICGVGPCNWAQPAAWPCSEQELRAAAFPEASESFIRAAISGVHTLTERRNGCESAELSNRARWCGRMVDGTVCFERNGPPSTWCVDCLSQKASTLLAAPAPAVPDVGQALTALEFAAGAIIDAVGLEDGLDGLAGERVLRMINVALVAHGRQPVTIGLEAQAPAVLETEPDIFERGFRKGAADCAGVVDKMDAMEREINSLRLKLAAWPCTSSGTEE